MDQFIVHDEHVWGFNRNLLQERTKDKYML